VSTVFQEELPEAGKHPHVVLARDQHGKPVTHGQVDLSVRARIATRDEVILCVDAKSYPLEISARGKKRIPCNDRRQMIEYANGRPRGFVSMLVYFDVNAAISSGDKPSAVSIQEHTGTEIRAFEIGGGSSSHPSAEVFLNILDSVRSVAKRAAEVVQSNRKLFQPPERKSTQTSCHLLTPAPALNETVDQAPNTPPPVQTQRETSRPEGLDSRVATSNPPEPSELVVTWGPPLHLAPYEGGMLLLHLRLPQKKWIYYNQKEIKMLRLRVRGIVNPRAYDSKNALSRCWFVPDPWLPEGWMERGEMTLNAAVIQATGDKKAKASEKVFITPQGPSLKKFITDGGSLGEGEAKFFFGSLGNQQSGPGTA
jgi:hypothetical protein